MIDALRLGLRSDVVEGVSGEGSAARPVLSRPGAEVFVPHPETPEGAGWMMLKGGPVDEGVLDAHVGSRGPTSLARWWTWRDAARVRGILTHRLMNRSGAQIAEFIVTRHGAPDLATSHPADSDADRLRLSRFAILSRGAEGMTLESPLAGIRVVLGPSAAALVTAFAEPSEAQEAVRAAPALDASIARAFIAALRSAELLGAVDESGRLGEDRDPVLSQWEVPDLLLHTRSRTMRTDQRSGATFRFAGIRPAPDALPFRAGSPEIALARPDLARRQTDDVPLARVMEERESRRELGPLDDVQLGEFLYRTVRVRHVLPAANLPHGYARISGPLPAPGAMHELTTYLAVRECGSLQPGLYRYDPIGHGLDFIAAGPNVDLLLDDAAGGSGQDTPPPLLVILVADFRRLSWKYEAIAYAAMLKDVGVVQLGMQLVATAMGLGSCAIGGGDSETFARAAGTAALEHSSVGEFIVGS